MNNNERKKKSLIERVFITLSLVTAVYMLLFGLGFSSIFFEIVRDLSRALNFKVAFFTRLIEMFTFVGVQHMAIFIGLVAAHVIIKNPIKRKEKEKELRKQLPVYDWILFVLVLVPFLYIFFVYDSLSLRQGIVYPIDVVFGVIAIFLILEAGRRALGWALMLLTIGFLAYGFINSNYDVKNFVSMMYLYNIGFWGTPTWVATFYIYFFMFFANMLTQIGFGEYFINTATSLAGSKKGGPAKIAVLASATLGMMTGSATGNVLTTGSFTIPLMKKTGYKPETAGAIEAAASTGGQIMPPVLGSASFIMAVYLGMKYIKISVAAILPAVLYFSALYFFVDLEASKAGLKGLARDKLPPRSEIFKKGFYILPIVMLIWMLAKGFSPQYAAMAALGLAIVIEWLAYQKNPLKHRFVFIGIFLVSIAALLLLRFEIENLPPILGVIIVFLTIFYGFFCKGTRRMSNVVVTALRGSVTGSLGVVMACVLAGLIEGVLLYTGLTLRLSNMFIALSGGNLFILMVLSMIIAIILGMGMPTPAVYVITSITLAPAMVKLGVPPIAAHFFLFFFGILGPLTPPVAVTSFAAAAVSGGDFWKTGIQAFRAAIVAAIVPFMFVFRPELLIIPVESWTLTWVLRTVFYFGISSIGALCTVVALGNYLFGKLPPIERSVLFIGIALSFLTIVMNPYFSLALAGVILFEIYQVRKRKAAGEGRADA